MAEEREIKYRFSATENVSTVSSRVQQALKNARKSDRAEAIDEVAKLAKGAGALVALEMISGGLETATKQIAEFKEMARGGAVTWGDYVEGIAKSVPIYGQVIAAGREFRKEIDGTNDAIRKAARDAAASEAVGGILFGARADANTAGKEGAALARAQAENELEAKVKAIEDVRRSHKESLTLFQNKELDRAESEAKKRTDDAILKIESDYYRERTQIVADGEAKLRDLKAATRAEGLRAIGKDLEAEVLEIRAARDAQIRALVAETREKLKNEADPGRQADILAQRGRTAEAINRDREQKEILASERDRNAQEQKKLDLTEQGIQFLERELDLGNNLVRQDVERLKIAQDFARQRAEINQQIEKATPEEKAFLNSVLQGLNDQEQRAVARVGQGRFSGGLAPTETGAFLTGVASKSREGDPANQLVKFSAETAKNTKAIADSIMGVIKTPTQSRTVPRDFK